MLVRVAACAAWFFAWPVCAGIDGTTLPLPGIAIAMAQEQTALAPLTAVPVEAQPFGIAAVPVTDGEILRKWMGTQPEIRADDKVLARCRQASGATLPGHRR
jgi:hypothetical protein